MCINAGMNVMTQLEYNFDGDIEVLAESKTALKISVHLETF